MGVGLAAPLAHHGVDVVHRTAGRFALEYAAGQRSTTLAEILVSVVFCVARGAGLLGRGELDEVLQEEDRDAPHPSCEAGLCADDLPEVFIVLLGAQEDIPDRQHRHDQDVREEQAELTDQHVDEGDADDRSADPGVLEDP